jgi:hypothetical protein
MKTRRWLFVPVLCAVPAAAQTPLPEMNFDMWCQQQQLPPARCDKRLPGDDAAFRHYVDTIERYETQQLNSQANDRRLDRMIDRADPIDHPPEPPPGAGPQPQ